MKIQELFKEKFEDLDKLVSENLTNGRAKALAVTKLEEAYMWVGKAIRDEQVSRGIFSELPERKDG